jgi:hypothetical protein
MKADSKIEKRMLFYQMDCSFCGFGARSATDSQYALHLILASSFQHGSAVSFEVKRVNVGVRIDEHDELVIPILPGSA